MSSRQLLNALERGSRRWSPAAPSITSGLVARKFEGEKIVHPLPRGVVHHLLVVLGDAAHAARGDRHPLLAQQEALVDHVVGPLLASPGRGSAGPAAGARCSARTCRPAAGASGSGRGAPTGARPSRRSPPACWGRWRGASPNPATRWTAPPATGPRSACPSWRAAAGRRFRRRSWEAVIVAGHTWRRLHGESCKSKIRLGKPPSIDLSQLSRRQAFGTGSGDGSDTNRPQNQGLAR